MKFRNNDSFITLNNKKSFFLVGCFIAHNDGRIYNFGANFLISDKFIIMILY